ncbi:uncharacterized protein [Periplaneta americana]|uniref:uncharacterized protein isoform X2 n=1 Tax=Periplaneta americana TaxID=6978 RepID=UPI0037E8E1D0
MALHVLIVFLCGLIACSAAPRTTVESNDLPTAQFGGDSVSASFGGYHASAGLGGTLNGGPSGGLFAQAGTPDGTLASAGLGGSVQNDGIPKGNGGAGTRDSSASSSRLDNRVVSRRPPDFFDNVFNIPISALQAVNQLLGGTPNLGGNRVHNRAEARSRTVASKDSTAPAPAPAPGGKSFFDDIFNIPISVLKSVNDLLNNKNRNDGQGVSRVAKA